MRYPALSLTLAMLESLFANEALCREFPFLGYAKRTWSNVSIPGHRGGCSGCRGGSAGREYKQHLLEMIKASVIGLPPERVSRFKDLLNTDKVVLHFAVRGQTITKEL